VKSAAVAGRQTKVAQAATAEVKAKNFLLSTMIILRIVCNKVFLILVLLA